MKNNHTCLACNILLEGPKRRSAHMLTKKHKGFIMKQLKCDIQKAKEDIEKIMSELREENKDFDFEIQEQKLHNSERMTMMGLDDMIMNVDEMFFCNIEAKLKAE